MTKRLIADAWLGHSACNPSGSRDSFYAGALAFAQIVVAQLSDDWPPTDADNSTIDALIAELQAYFQGEQH